MQPSLFLLSLFEELFFLRTILISRQNLSYVERTLSVCYRPGRSPAVAEILHLSRSPPQLHVRTCREVAAQPNRRSLVCNVSSPTECRETPFAVGSECVEWIYQIFPSIATPKIRRQMFSSNSLATHLLELNVRRCHAWVITRHTYSPVA
ncbi:Protein of unknown function [Pyronema omphalodes CBS 100304]|uniref:Uncharacterized protein n=1 Tax=Pyronema omphalodes (strain CBS 100304) TaxID=1076935 RepID=U4LUQ6_PYROM|nr:Protein of unknown function [Pyronema omphalodes CBS 100304]